MLRGWEPQKVGCGWYNGSVMIRDVALEKKKQEHKAKGWGIYSNEKVAQYLFNKHANMTYLLHMSFRNMSTAYVHIHSESGIKLKSLLCVLLSGSGTGAVLPCLLHFTPLKSGQIQVQTPVEWRIEHMEYSCRKPLKCRTQTQTQLLLISHRRFALCFVVVFQWSDAPRQMCLYQIHFSMLSFKMEADTGTGRAAGNWDCMIYEEAPEAWGGGSERSRNLLSASPFFSRRSLSPSETGPALFFGSRVSGCCWNPALWHVLTGLSRKTV